MNMHILCMFEGNFLLDMAHMEIVGFSPNLQNCIPENDTLKKKKKKKKRKKKMVQ